MSDLRALRKWAQEAGRPLPPRGRPARDLIDAYLADTGIGSIAVADKKVAIDCLECGVPLPPYRRQFCSHNCYYRNYRRRPEVLARRAAETRRYVRVDPERKRLQDLRQRHGKDGPEWWDATWNEQAGLCYLCGKPMDRESAHVDHDHDCCPPRHSCETCRRGLAHSACNLLIGHAHDDPALLRTIADNLERKLRA